MFTKKPKPLSLTKSENYSFVASFDKISSNNKKIYLLKFSNFLGISIPPPPPPQKKICMVSPETNIV